MEDWKDVHKDFAKEYGGKTYQQVWEEEGFTYQDAKGWVKTGLEPWDWEEVKEWKNFNFTPQQLYWLMIIKKYKIFI